jgi:hypothetical protein
MTSAGNPAHRRARHDKGPQENPAAQSKQTCYAPRCVAQ